MNRTQLCNADLHDDSLDFTPLPMLRALDRMGDDANNNDTTSHLSIALDANMVSADSE